ncbi:DUF1430 domain-containing protein [Enterococcus sp. DIV1314a]|uniref:DUF1430 domain-containing protein n=1 Tax=Enterococcus sp. DIV1314a TaxID=2774660 RepID=UPI003F20C35A
MRKSILFLISIQMFVLSLYGLLFINSYATTSLNADTTSLSLVFKTNEEYQFFLDQAEKQHLTVSKEVFIDDNNVIIYTSDLSLAGRIKLTKGRLPLVGENEFISVNNTGEAAQVGTFKSIAPGFNLAVSHIENAANVSLDGIFFVHSSDKSIIEPFVYLLEQNIHYVELLSINNQPTLLNRITERQMIEFIVISLLLFICVITAFISYAVRQLKASAVFLIHGHSKFFVLKKATIDLLKLLGQSFIVSYILTILYAFLSGYSSLFPLISIAFVGVFLILSIFYVVVFQLFMSIYLSFMKTTQILKGRTPHVLLQSIQYLTKFTFSVTIFVFSGLAIANIGELNDRLAALSDWELARNTHYTQVYSVGQSNDLAIDLEIATDQVALYESLAKEKNAFIMDSRNIYYMDLGARPYVDMETAPSLALSPHGYSVTISPNFLDLNPIIASNGIAVQEQINWDSDVLNILVPEKLSMHEDEILQLYLEDFYFSKIDIENIYNNELGLTENTREMTELSVNIIYVKDNQHYFTFNDKVRVTEGNKILDPIAMIYTGSVHPSRLSETMSGSFFFQTSNIDAYGDLSSFLAKYNLSHVIRSTVSVFNQQGKMITQLQNQIKTSIFLIILLAISSVTVLYGLMAQYFEKNKKIIFIKSIYGYSFIRRHDRFLLFFILSSISIAGISAVFLGTSVLGIGLLLLVFDLTLLFFIDQRLRRTSFATIIKGGD